MDVHAAWLLSFVSSQKDNLFFQISLHSEEFERSRAHAAAQERCIRSAYAQLAAFDRFEVACNASIRSHGIDLLSIAPVSSRGQLVSLLAASFRRRPQLIVSVADLHHIREELAPW